MALKGLEERVTERSEKEVRLRVAGDAKRLKSNIVALYKRSKPEQASLQFLDLDLTLLGGEAVDVGQVAVKVQQRKSQAGAWSEVRTAALRQLIMSLAPGEREEARPFGLELFLPLKESPDEYRLVLEIRDRRGEVVDTLPIVPEV